MTSLPPNVVFLSFEGPDPYSMVGGLGTRVTEMSAAVAESGRNATLVFVGDPDRPPVERPSPNLELRRWSQWISAGYRADVYDGELDKMRDYTESVPPFVIRSIVEPAAVRREQVLVIGEDWQTAPSIIALDEQLRESGFRDRVTLAWNANNTYGFHTIDWRALTEAARIMTVSRYMKFELAARGVDPLVIPNGIPRRLLEGAPKKLVRDAVKQFRDRRPLFVKVARFDEDKRWMQVVDAFASLVERYPEATLVIRGGREEYGLAVTGRARDHGLHVEDLTIGSREPEDVLAAIAAAPGSVVNVKSFIPEDALYTLYHAADAVLANSGREPFGLVGLEVMAVGGLAVTGSTGEDYVQPFSNALVCDTGDARELRALLESVVTDHEKALAIAEAGEATARRYAWPDVLEILGRKLGSNSRPAGAPAESSPVRGALRLVQGRGSVS